MTTSIYQTAKPYFNCTMPELWHEWNVYLARPDVRWDDYFVTACILGMAPALAYYLWPRPAQAIKPPQTATKPAYANGSAPLPAGLDFNRLYVKRRRIGPPN